MNAEERIAELELRLQRLEDKLTLILKRAQSAAPLSSIIHMTETRKRQGGY